MLLITLPLQTKAPEPEFFRALPPVPPSTSERVVLLELLAVNETVAEPPNVSWVPVPKELLPLSATLVTASVPPPIVTFPLKVLAPERVSVFAAFLVTEPDPLIALVTVVASERLKIKLPLLAIAPSTDPLVPPAPIYRIPLEMVVPPV